jgi:hypothetical protein
LFAFTATLLLFAFWAFVGYGVLAVLPSRLRVLTNMLLAPAVGVALTVTCLFVVSRWGVPVITFARALVVVLTVGAAAALVLVRPLIAVRRYLPFAALFVLNLFLIGRPMQEFGFDWVSFGNDDMANYCLSAARFIDHGFFDVPTAESLEAGRNTAEWYWFMQVPCISRSGSDLTLAWVSCVTGQRLSTHQVFMPVSLALNMALLSAAVGFVFSSCRSWRVAFASACLMSVSAQVAMGVIQQLIGQVGGLCLLCANLTVYLRAIRGNTFRAQLRPALLSTVLLTGELIWYPEALPFLGFTFIALTAVRVVRRQLAWRATGWHLGIVTAACLLLVNRYFVDALDFLASQGRDSTTTGLTNLEKFPFYMLPIGFGNVWGIQMVRSSQPEPWQSFSIVVGFLLLAATVGYALRQAWRGNAVALQMLIMLALVPFLYQKQMAFGLFKLAMYAAPFLLASFALLCLRTIRNPGLAVVPLALVGFANFNALSGYVAASTGNSQYCEIHRATESRISRVLHNAVRAVPAKRIVADALNRSLAKYEALNTRGIPTDFVSGPYFYEIGARPVPHSSLGSTPYQAEGARLRKEYESRLRTVALDLHDPEHPGAGNQFVVDTGQWEGVEGDGVYFALTTGVETVFNRRHLPGDDGQPAVLRAFDQVHNHLAFVYSALSRPYYYHDAEEREKFGFSQTEADYYYPGNTMEAVGRHLLFQVLRPTPKFRLLVDLTTTLRMDHGKELPPAAVVGSRRIPLPFCGSGSARVVSEPLSPAMILGRPYIDLDMGEYGSPMRARRLGLNTLWGKQINDDSRLAVAFARDITLITEQEYRSMTPPAVLWRFPNDLGNPDLEYSGIFEHGFVANEAYAVLSRPAGESTLAVKGSVWGGNSPPKEDVEIEVRVGGQVVHRGTLPVGPFDLRLPAGVSSGGREKVELHFSNVYPLPAEPKTAVAARLERLGFEAAE